MSWKNEVKKAMEMHIAARQFGETSAVIETYSNDWTDSKGFTKESLRDDFEFIVK